MPRDAFCPPVEGKSPVYGAFITFDSMPMVEILASLGFDYLAIDTQHALLDVVTAGKLIYAIPTNLPVLVRMMDANAGNIAKALDAGADGVIVPMVSTAAEAAAAVAACRYNPDGVRSFGPIRKHIGFDPKALQERAVCFAMIETVEAVENIEEIVNVPGLTGVYLGAGDLAVNLGLVPAGRPTPPQILDASQRIAQACRKAGIIAGAHGQSLEHLRELLDAGFSMVTLSGDRTYVTQGASGFLKGAREMGGAGQ